MPINNFWTWTVLSVSAVAFVALVGLEVRIMPDVVRVLHAPEKQDHINQETEDALKLATLHTLTRGPNSHLAKTAHKIIARRASQGEAYTLLLKRLASKNEEERLKALQALSFLAQSPFVYNLNTAATFRALVEALTHFVPPQYEPPTNHVRSAGERRAVWIMYVLIQYSSEDALAAGIIPKWLCHYHFGDTVKEIQETIENLLQWNSRDTDMSGILSAIQESAEGRRQLREAGLTGAKKYDEDEEDTDAIMFDAEENIADEPSPTVARQRIRTEDEEEQNVRRRRREAMVISDGVEPIGRDDIIQREHSQGSTFETRGSAALVDTAEPIETSLSLNSTGRELISRILFFLGSSHG